MRIKEFLTELGDKKSPYFKYHNNEFLSILSTGHELKVTFSRPTTLPIRNALEIEFTVDNSHSLTNHGNQFEVFSTVLNILQHELFKQLTENDKHVIFTADMFEQSRVSFYTKKVVPLISKLLSNEWQYSGEEEDTHFHEMMFIWSRK